MKLLPRSVTISGLVLAVASVLMDAQITPLLVPIIGAHGATKLAALGALIAALGRALIHPTTEQAPHSEQ